MKNYLICLALIYTLASTQAAPPSDQSIAKMMETMQVEKMLDQMMTQMESGMRSGMEQGMQQALHGTPPTPAQKAKAEDFQKKLAAILRDELSFAKMKDIYIQVYRETFTQDEIDKIIAFYSSPAGKAMVEKVPVAMQKAGELMRGRMGPLMQKFQGMMGEFQTEIEKTK